MKCLYCHESVDVPDGCCPQCGLPVHEDGAPYQHQPVTVRLAPDLSGLLRSWLSAPGNWVACAPSVPMLSLAALLGLCVGGSAGWLVTYRPVLKTAQAEAPELAVAEAPDAVPAAVPEPDPAGLPTSLESAPAEAPPAEAPPADETRREPAPPEARRAPEVRFTAPPSEPVPPSPFLAADPFRPRQPVRVTLVYLSPTAHAVPSEETPEPAGE